VAPAAEPEPVAESKAAPSLEQPEPEESASTAVLPAASPESAEPLAESVPEAPKQSPAVRPAAAVIPIEGRRPAKPKPQRRLVVVGDCENDVDSVQASLRFLGLLGKRGQLKARARGTQIVQTGDLLHKNGPSPDVVRFWEGLRSAAEADGYALHLVAGNHELEIWRRLRAGERLGLSRPEQGQVRELIRRMQLFHVDGSMLFIHGYPTVELLRDMQVYRAKTGKSLNDYNRDCFQPSFDDPARLARYSYPRRNTARGCLLHDAPDPRRYYRLHGGKVAALLASLGLDTVVHGHRPERAGVQTDYEWQQWIPGVRMINNDIQLRLQGLGATVIRQMDRGAADVLFVNANSATAESRAQARRLLRAEESGAKGPRTRLLLDGQVSAFVRNRTLGSSHSLTASKG